MGALGTDGGDGLIRITRIDAGDSTTLQLEGRLTAEDLALLDESWRACMHEKRRVTIDLAGVRFVDEAGAAMLRALRHEPVTLQSCSPFVRALLEAPVR